MGRKSTRKPRSNRKEKISLDTSDKFFDTSPDKILDSSEKVSTDSKDCDVDTPFAEDFSEDAETGKEVITISDDENQIDSLLEEFMKEEAKVIHKSMSKVILSSDDDDDMEILLEEFSKDNSGDEKDSSEVKKKGRRKKKVNTKK